MGAAVGATDPDGDTLAYTLAGADAGSFTIDAGGQIRVGQDTSLDYETTTSYSVTVNVSDGKDAAGGADTAVDATVDVAIDVTDVEPELVLPPYFPFTITALNFDEPGEIDDIALPEAEGGDGVITYTLTGVPEGLSFDADTRTLSGTVAAGEHTLVYAATDEAGVQAAFSFIITVQSTLRSAPSTQEDINWQRPNIRDLHVGRNQSSEPAAPALEGVLEHPGHVQGHVRRQPDPGRHRTVRAASL